MPKTIAELLRVGRDDAAAILTPDGPTLTYADLRHQVETLAGQLQAVGIGRGDRVACVLPNGPAAAIVFLAITTCATAAPLNPAYREAEFRFYLDDLKAKALITLPDDAMAAHAAAPPSTLRLSLSGEAGSFSLSRDGQPIALVAFEPAQPEDVALLLHTSGTTGRPKLVPLSQRNLTVSAVNIATSLGLTEGDRALNVMPLFHVHGLMAALLASLSVGASVVTTPGFDAFKFFDWLQETRPSWYTAVPTMHQLILSRAGRHADLIAQNPMSFVRSSSAPLPPVVMEELEAVFGCPAIEAYGMTEASHQIATHQLPPGVRKPGAVGPGANVEVAVMDEAGKLLPQGAMGEVVIKGSNVTAGYESEGPNAATFTDGWFRTGDQGYLDQDGYLFLAGRLKEIINRGGEKVSPREVEEVLLRHPAVAQAVTFALPHERLGEEVAAAVVLKNGAAADEKDLRAYAAESLADFKLPRTLVIVPDIPKGPTGKVQRIGMAERLGLIPNAEQDAGGA